MKIRTGSAPRGIALIIVMLVIIVLAVIAGGFALSMKVETTLARNGNFETDLEWLGRSGVEEAKCILALQATVANEPYDSLNQKWAGGTGGAGTTNDALSQISLEDNQVGNGHFSIKITDQERKININIADQSILQQALTMMGVDGANTSVIIDSILDWRDPDNDTHLSGWESDDYLRLEPPYVAKNGPIDDISELLRIHGVAPEIFWGSHGTNSQATYRASRLRSHFQDEPPTYPFGLVDLFAAISARQVNINTVSSEVLQVVPGIDPNLATFIMNRRRGPDGVDGTEDDIPFRSVAEIPFPGGTQGASQVMSIFAVRSQTFEVQVEARIGDAKKQFVAMLRRSAQNPRDLQVLYMYAK
jgi:type II secretory pathway component PulK